MSSSRNKRKRPESDAATSAPASRRRSREQRAAPEPPAPATDDKNEQAKSRMSSSGDAHSVPHGPQQQQQAQGGEDNNKSEMELSNPTKNKKSHERPSLASSNNGSGNSEKNAAPLPSPDFDQGSTSRQQEYRPFQPASSETSGTNKTVEGKEIAAQPADHERESRIRSLLSHRRLLLHRIKLCRSAAQDRIEKDLAHSSRIEVKSEADQKNSEKGDKSSASSSGHDHEIAAFREMTRLATLAAKKSRSDADGAAEKRTSLSLRRGSSVGKRMNAALSSLAPGGSASVSSDATATQPMHMGNVAPPKPLPKLQQATGISANPTFESTAASRGVTAPLVGPPIPAAKPLKTTSSQIVQRQASMGVPSKFEATQKLRPLNSKSLKNISAANSRMSSASRTESTNMPLHLGATSASLPQNRLAQPKVIFPEAIALREQRSRTQAKLAALLDRQKRTQGTMTLTRRESTANAGASSASGTRKRMKAAPLETLAAARLPKRRKTHWDHLLQEMTWMATDFMEERKWKLSAARTIGSAILTPGIVTGSRKPPDSDRHQSNPGEPTTIDGMERQQTTPDESSSSMDSTSGKNKSHQGRQYAKLSAEDAKEALRVARAMSCMVSALTGATLEAGPISETDEEHVTALQRYQRNFEEMQNDTTAASRSPIGVDANLSGDRVSGNKALSCTVGQPFGIAPSSVALESPKETLSEKSLAAISKIIQASLLAVSGFKRKQAKNRVERGRDTHNVFKLSSMQTVALQFIQHLWEGDNTNGGILVGPGASGKTIMACSLIWSCRARGPQLLVCPPATVIRWTHELGRFDGLRVLSVGFTGGISNPSSDNELDDTFDSGDVVVCEYSLVSLALPRLWTHRSKFHSVLVDCRHPGAFYASQELSADNKAPSVSGRAMDSWNGPPELLSADWWRDLTGFLLHGTARRLIIQCPGSDALSLSRSGMADRQQLEILAFHVAFVLGPTIFYSPGVTLLRRVLTWARCHEKKSTPDKIERVRKAFRDVTEAFTFEIPGGLGDTCLWTGSRSWYKLHGCPLQLTQRTEYDKCCAEVRGTLSGCLESAHKGEATVLHSFEAVSTALIRLRRKCFHANMRSALATPTVRTRFGKMYSVFWNNNKSVVDGKSGVFFRGISNSPSQPDSNVAYSILEGSSKLRELLRILKNDCNYHIVGGEVVDSLLRSQKASKASKSKSSRKSNRRKKVAILAVLPEVQMLVSTLLNAVGVNHELLLRASTATTLSSGGKDASLELNHGKSDPIHDEVRAVAWAEHQRILARFNNIKSESSDCNIIVAAPACVSGYGGMGVEGADFVLCLDEDWSGRGEFLMRYVLARWLRSQNGSESVSPRLMRLVAAGTCEENLLAGGKSEHKEPQSEGLRLQLSLSGHFVLSKSTREAIVHGSRTHTSSSMPCFAFPALNLMTHRGDDLSKLLAPSTQLPPMFGSSSPAQFLPSAESLEALASKRRCQDEEASSEVGLVRELLRRETGASLGIPKSQEHDGFIVGDEIDSPSDALFASPPPSLSFPRMMMTRQDLVVISSRIYLGRVIKSAVRTELGTVTVGGSEAQVPSSALTITTKAMKSDAPADNATDSNFDLADAWHKSGLSCKPDDLAVSLLFYRVPQEGFSGDESGDKSNSWKNSKAGRNQTEKRYALDTKSNNPRSNAYARAFTASKDGNLLRDGNQGCEPLVYFPPLFPKLQHSFLQAREADLLGTKETSIVLENSAPGGDFLPVKRKDHETMEGRNVPSAKRPRVQLDYLDASAGVTAILPQQHHLLGESVGVHPQPKPSRHPSSAQLPVASTGSPNAALPLARDAGDDPNRVNGEDEVPLGEDYGLIGIGAMASLSEVSKAVANDVVHRVRGIASADGLTEEGNLPCDAEDAEAMARQATDNVSLDSVVLFVKKKSRGFPSLPDAANQLYRPPPSAIIPDTVWSGPSITPGVPAGGLGTSNLIDINGAASSKKTKKKIPSHPIVPMPGSAFSRIPAAADLPQIHASAHMPVALQLAKGKDGFRERLLASFVSRQIGTGLTMFESASFRVAALRVQNRIGDRFAQACWKSSLAHEVGPGIPLGFAKQQSPSDSPRRRVAASEDNPGWTIIVKRLKKNSATGDLARSQASSQRSSLRRSLVSPCRVDFGPFGGGFLSLQSGMTGISPPKSRIGVSLPMGVKVPQTLREHQHHTWSSADDQLLQECAVRFGMNWMLVARALSGLEDIIVDCRRDHSAEVERRSLASSRSARQCRDRWEALARNQPSLANEVRKSERDLRESARLRKGFIPGGDVSALKVDGPDSQAAIVLLSKPSVFGAEPKGAADLKVTTMQKDSTSTISRKDPLGGSGGELGESETTPTEYAPSITSNKPRRSFESLKSARSKTRFFPLTIPGAVGSNPPTLVPSHPSHMQSVQESAAAQSSSGRTEMWPLQILDVADKQRAASAVAPHRSTSSAGSSTQRSNGPSPSNASSNASRRPATSGSAASHTHRSGSYQAPNAKTQRVAGDRSTSFPPVPANSGRSVSSSQQRPQQGTPTTSTQKIQQSPPSTQSYAPPPPSTSSRPSEEEKS